METPIPVKLTLLRWILVMETGDVTVRATPEQENRFLSLELEPRELSSLSMKTLTAITNDLDWDVLQPYLDWCDREAEKNFEEIPKHRRPIISAYWYVLNELRWAKTRQTIPGLV